MYKLRPYQSKGVDELRATYRRGFKAPLYVLATGGGKTVTFCYIAYHAALRGKRAVICVHRRELLNQASASLKEMGVPHGLIQAGQPINTNHLIQVASVQTLVRRKNLDFDLLVFDEAHHATANTWSSIIKRYDKALVLGVTATPCRMSGNGLSSVFDTMILGPSMKYLISNGYLVQPECWCPGVIDFSGFRSRGGDYRKEDIVAVMDKKSITGDVIKHYKKLCDGQPTIAFCVSVAHAEHVAEQFRDAGYRATSVDGKLKQEERDSRISGLADGRYQVVTSCDLISEGLDIPRVNAAILLRPTKSLNLYLQQVGRALRPAEGKDKALILDHTGNVLKHGLPEWKRAWSLEEGAKVKREVEKVTAEAIRQCAFCWFTHEWSPACPNCGYEYPQAPKPEPKTEEGDLIKITKEEAHGLARFAKTHAEFKRIGKAAGFKPQWAYFKMKAQWNKKKQGRTSNA